MASAGRLACSYTAEFVALTGSIIQFAPLILDNSRVLIAVDSQSLLQALKAGHHFIPSLSMVRPPTSAALPPHP